MALVGSIDYVEWDDGHKPGSTNVKTIVIDIKINTSHLKCVLDGEKSFQIKIKLFKYIR